MKYSEDRNKKISNSKRHKFDEIEKRIYEIDSNITILETEDTYIDTKHKIKIRCNICNHEYSATPNNILVHHTGCPYCKHNLTYTNETFDAKLKELQIENLERIDDYINNNTPIRFKCKKCNYIWKVRPCHILEGRTCPHCKQSYLEFFVERLLIKNKITYEIEKSFYWLLSNKKKHLYLDFYLPEYNIGIECQGIQHFIPTNFGGNASSENLEKMFNEEIERDNLKRNLCEEHGIKLIYYSNLHMIYPYDVCKTEEELINNICN